MPCGACIHLHCKAIEICSGFVFFLFPREDTSVQRGSLFLGFLLPSCPVGIPVDGSALSSAGSCLLCQPCSSDHSVNYLVLEKGAWVSQGSSLSVHPSQKVGCPLGSWHSWIFLPLRSPGAVAGSQPEGTHRTHLIPQRHLGAGLAFPPQITLSVFVEQDNWVWRSAAALLGSLGSSQSRAWPA